MYYNTHTRTSNQFSSTKNTSLEIILYMKPYYTYMKLNCLSHNNFKIIFSLRSNVFKFAIIGYLHSIEFINEIYNTLWHRRNDEKKMCPCVCWDSVIKLNLFFFRQKSPKKWRQKEEN